MANRVNINVTARDLTRPQLQRMRQNFRSLGQDIDRAVGRRTRENFNRLSQSTNQAARDLRSMRGSIPDDEFFRLDAAIRRSQRTLQRGFGHVGDRAFARVVARLREVDDGFRQLDEDGEIRVRVDNSALVRADARLAAWRTTQARNAVRVPVRPDVRSHTWRRLLLRALTSPFRVIGSTLGGLLSDGIGQGLIGGLRAMGPVVGGIVGTILVGAAVGAVSLLGAAIAGALVFALGGAVAGIGIMIAAQSEEVKKKWSNSLGVVKKLFGEAAKPMLPVIEVARNRMIRLARDWAPHFESVLTSMQGPLNVFIGAFDRGLRQLVSKAGPDLKNAFNTFLIAFGPQFETLMRGLGDSLGALARTVRDNSTEIAMALRMVLGLITTIIDIVNFLTNVWVSMFHGAINGAAALVDAWASLTDGVLEGVERMLGAMETVAGIVGMDGPVRQAKENFRRMRESQTADLRGVADEIRGLGTTIKNQNQRNILRANILDIQAKVRAAKAKLQTVTDKKVRAQIKADISQLEAAERRARQKLAAIDGTTAITRIITYSDTYKSVHDIVGKASGGVIGAATGGVRSNLTLVGERGPELVSLPGGSRVHSNNASRQMMGGGGDGMAPFVLLVEVGGKEVAQLMVDPFRREVSRRGGVVATFGKL